jgi:4-amino-4-deoxy-L-arabinose transferase-like glycosyltransferase
MHRTPAPPKQHPAAHHAHTPPLLQPKPARQHVLWIALVLFASALYLFGLGSLYAPTNGDEMVYLHIARQTAESGQWLPLVSDLANMRNTKPPLLFWQAMVAGDWAGWDLAALRLPSVVYTFLTTAMVALLVWRMDGRLRTACLAAVLYLAFFSTFRYGRVYLTSAPETFWLALPLFYLLWKHTPSHTGPANHAAFTEWTKAPTNAQTLPWWGFALFGLAIGLGAAYKSFALVAPAAATLWCALLVAQRPLRWAAVWRTSVGVALAALIALALFGLWFVLDPDPAAVWREFVVGENAGKLASARGYWHNALAGGGSVWVHSLAYFENAGLLFFVALGLAVWGAGQALGGSRWRKLPPHTQILLVWLLVWLLVFAIPSQRSARYVIPAMPALAVLAALYWERIARPWFLLSLLLTVPALVLLARIAWVMADMEFGSPWLLAMALAAAALGLAAVLAGLLRPAWSRNATLLACLSVYACFGAMVAPLSTPAAGYSGTVKQQLQGARVAVPNGFNAQYERFRFVLPGAQPTPYDTDGRNVGEGYPDLPPDARLQRLLAEFDAVVWIQEQPDRSAPSCVPGCRVLAQRWHVKSRHKSGEITLDNLWTPQQWLFRREWLVVPAP